MAYICFIVPTGRNMRVFLRQRHDAESERWWWRRWRTCKPNTAYANPPAVAGAAARRCRGKARHYHKAPRSQTP